MRCPSCQHDNRSTARFCLGCGGPLSLRCPSCDQELPEGAAFCDGCGQALGEAAPAASSVAPAPPLPDSFASGRYRVERFLGEGAKKRVYLARDTRLDRDVAIAVIKTEGLDADTRVRVQREAQAMGRLGDHPNIVTVYDIAEEDEQLFIVSQFMSGGDLESRLRSHDGRGLPLEEAARIAGELSRALEHAHERGVIHRDLTPGNVWLAEDGTATLGDFGLALSLQRTRLTQEGMMVGTVAYMPPEQALGRTGDARSDLYALGTTLYEMLAGHPPFTGDDAVAVISQHINTPPVAPSWHRPEVPKPLEDLVLSLLEKDPAKRPESAAAVRARLDELAATPSAPASPAEQPRANPLDRLASGVFVGREREIERLRAGLDESLSGHAVVLMLVGEPGIGKTRTAEELRTYARMRGAQVLWGHCYEGDGAPAYWPWMQVIRTYIGEREPQELLQEMGPGASDIAEVVSEVRARLPGLPEPPKLDPEQARFRLFEGVVTFLRNASAKTPLVLVLDDLHWADKPSLLLLEFLVREIGAARLLVLGTYRDVELRRQHPLSETLAELARQQQSERILLRGLEENDVARFIEQTARVEPPRGLVDAVYRETEGNPFFVHEVVRLLAADGRLERPEAVESWSVQIPQGVREVVGRRLNRLGDTCNQALGVASVIGRDFDLPVLQQVSEIPERELLDALEEALAARVVEESDDALGRYRFSHALVQETLYEELTTPRRVRLHRQAGEVLEALHAAQPGPHLAKISHHFFQSVQASGVGRTVEAATRAGDWAREHLAFEDAAAHYERAVQALELAEAPDPRRHCELLVSLAELLLDAGDPERRREVSQRAIELCREIDDPELLARAVLALGGGFGMTEMGRVDEAMIALLNEALGALGTDDSTLRVRLLMRLSGEFFFSGDPERIRPPLVEAQEIARRLGDAALQCELIFVGTMVLTDPVDYYESGIRGADEMRLLAEASGDRALLQMSYGIRFQTCIWRGEVEAADAALEECERRADELRTPAARYFPAVMRSMRTMLGGRLDEARRLADAALAHGQRAIDRNALQWYVYQLNLLATLRGDPPPPGDIQFGTFDYPAYRVAAALLAVQRAEREGALEHFEILARHDFEDLPRDGNWPVAMSILVQVCIYLGDRARARVLYDLILPAEPLHVTLGAAVAYFGPLRARLGQLAELLERFGDGERYFQKAIEELERMGARPFLATTRYQYARLLRARGEAGDRERAFDELNAALAIAQDVGMNGLVKDALALKVDLQGIASGTLQRSIDLVALSVERRRPDLGERAAPDGTVTLMFSDMEGFTEMTEALGDLAAREVIREHNRIVREQVAAHGGYEVELQGDGFLLAFGSARSALLCAVGIQRAFAAYSEAHVEQPIRVRIGVHTGEALKDADKFFGKTVIMAARIAAQAAGGEILVSSLLKQLTESVGDVRFGATREVELKGFSERQRVVEVDWA